MSVEQDAVGGGGEVAFAADAVDSFETSGSSSHSSHSVSKFPS